MFACIVFDGFQDNGDGFRETRGLQTTDDRLLDDGPRRLQETNQWTGKESDKQLVYNDRESGFELQNRYQLNPQIGNILAQHDYLRELELFAKEKERLENALNREEEEKLKERLNLQAQKKKLWENDKLLQRRYYDNQLHKEYNNDDFEELYIQSN